MRITVIGRGHVGGGLAQRWTTAGHDVTSRRFAVGPSVRVRVLLPGAVAAAAGMIVLVVGFGAYASASTHYTAVYGVFAGAVIAMVATYLAVYAVLLGAVLNVELSQDRSRD